MLSLHMSPRPVPYTCRCTTLLVMLCIQINQTVHANAITVHASASPFPTPAGIHGVAGKYDTECVARQLATL